MTAQEQYIKRCLELAARGKGNVAPNPMVGAVLVYKDRIIGEGWHKMYGHAHAEVNCFASVQDEDKQYIPHSTMYVSLEPCAHYGNTPPCANRLVEEQVKEVVICNVDPNPKVNGGGIEILKKSGASISAGILKAEGDWLNRRFFHSINNHAPYVILKWAQTPKGYMAPINRERVQISSKASMQLVHKWRTEEQAILVGYNTALHDNPQLTARTWQGKHPLRIVVDKNLSLPQTLHLFTDENPTWVVNTVREGQDGNVTYKKITKGESMPKAVVEMLAQENIQSLIVEGGAKLLNEFINEGLWQEARVFTGADVIAEGITAPKLQDEVSILNTTVGTDRLALYVNNNSSLTYQQGWDL